MSKQIEDRWYEIFNSALRGGMDRDDAVTTADMYCVNYYVDIAKRNDMRKNQMYKGR